MQSHPHAFICAESEHIVYLLMSSTPSLRTTRQRVQIYSHHYLTWVCWELGKSKLFAEMCIDFGSLTTKSEPSALCKLTPPPPHSPSLSVFICLFEFCDILRVAVSGENVLFLRRHHLDTVQGRFSKKRPNVLRSAMKPNCQTKFKRPCVQIPD